MSKRSLVWITGSVYVALVAVSGCGSDSDGSQGFEELYEQGLTKYVDQFEPTNEPAADADGIKTFEFAVPDDPMMEPRGPLCLRGGQYTVDSRAGSSDDLVIFLQGGGACWPELCQAFETTNSLRDSSGGILDPELEANPLADWDVVYLPYCDGSLFAGDVDRLLPPSGISGGMETESTMGYQRGLQNLTAALDIAVAEFPNPTRVALSGISGGAFGTIVALPLVRFYYPNAEILVLNDSGVGVGKDGDPDFINETLLAGWNATSLVPDSCPDCTANGHVTRLIEWQLDADPNVVMSAMSFSADFVISVTFLGLAPADFTGPLLAETGRIAANFPDRYRRFIPVGIEHTMMLLARPSEDSLVPLGSFETEVGGVTLGEWLTGMVDGTEDWVDLVDESLE